MAEVHSDSVRWARLAVIAAGAVITAHGRHQLAADQEGAVMRVSWL